MSLTVRPVCRGVLMFLVCSQASLFSATLDLLQPEHRDRWITVSGKPGVVVLSPVPRSTALKLSRADGTLESSALLGYFGKDGLMVPSSPKPAGITLGRVGDSLGVRAEVSYNSGARYHLYSHAFRLALGHSQGTRVTTPTASFSVPEFGDDTGWLSQISVDNTKSAFLRRNPSSKGIVLGSTIGAVVEKEWDRSVAKPVFQSGTKVEVIFSITRTSPDSLRLYAFVQGIEQEHVATGVSDFSFDTVCLLYPVPRTNTPAEMTLHELEMITLP